MASSSSSSRVPIVLQRKRRPTRFGALGGAAAEDDKLTGAPTLTDEGDIVETVLPDPFAVNKEMNKRRLTGFNTRQTMPVPPPRPKSGLQRTQSMMPDEEASVPFLLPRPLLQREDSMAPDDFVFTDTMVTHEEGDDLEETDMVAPTHPPSPAKKRKKRENKEAPVEKKARTTKPKQPATVKEAHEGFPGLRGWEPAGTVADVISALQEGTLVDGAWLQYTRNRSTFIPATRYKKLADDAKERGVELSDLIEGEKKSMIALGRKKTLCLASVDEDDDGTLKLTSIPPSGERASSSFPGQVRQWTLSTATDGEIKFYKKISSGKKR
jgi:hypothetical protein